MINREKVENRITQSGFYVVKATTEYLKTFEGAMANSRRDATTHITGVASPLNTLIYQFYLYGDSDVKLHWRKELVTILRVVLNNATFKKGGALKPHHIVEMLDSILTVRWQKSGWESITKDKDYSIFKARRAEKPQVKQLESVLRLIARNSVNNVSEQETADRVIEEILSW